ncbi:MAG: ABC transporter substrate-binding protein [Acidimicrobiaceae bacterium]|nr:ABC transporter substrate-binding protein [Acidimicrobiaceae bacterium]
MQAQAIASVVEASGSSTAIVVYLDDDYGRPFAEAAQEAIIARGTRVSATVAFTANEDSVSAAVEQVLANQPEVVAVIADGASGPAIINAIDAAATTRLTYVVNDAIRRPAPSAQPFSAQLSRKVVGVAPVAYATSPAFTQALLGVDPTTTGLYAHNAYDCLAIIALAAQATGSNQPRDLADAVSTVTTSGTGCTTFIACSAALTEGRNINYNGPIGNLSIGPSGNVTTADFDRFRFDASGRDVSDGTITIGND